jgi:hypothetical protein
LPGRFEQPLLRKAVLGVEDDQLGAWLAGLEVMRDQTCPLVGTGRAAERIGWRGEDDDPTVRHRRELVAQQQRLRARLPGMGHDRRRSLVVARQGVEAQVDAGRQHQPGVADVGTILQPNAPALGIDGDSPLADHRDVAELVIAEGLCLDAA